MRTTVVLPEARVMGRSGVGFEAAGVGEAGAVVTDLGEDPGGEQRTEARKAQVDLGVRVSVKRVGGGLLQLVGARAGRVELPEQGPGLDAHGLLDQRRLAHPRDGQDRTDPDGLGIDSALASGLAQQGGQAGLGELGGLLRGGGGVQDDAGAACGEVRGVAERGQEAR